MTQDRRPVSHLDNDYLARARARGVDFERRLTDRVVVTGFATITPFGDTHATWAGLLAGETRLRLILSEKENKRSRIGGLMPDDYDPRALLHKDDDRLGLSEVAAMSITTSREALAMAGLLDADGRYIRPEVNPTRVGVWVSSGIAATDKIIDIHDIQIARGARYVRPDLALQVFPEQLGGRTSIAINAAGWCGNTSEACATGASNMIEAIEVIRSGRADVVIAGGFETSLMTHTKETVATFSAVRSLSERNDAPELASRPFDRDRDGFVPSSGGAVMVLESLDHARRRGAPRAYAEIIGSVKSNDGAGRNWQGGFKATELDSERVAESIAEALYDREARALRSADAIFAHATSTKVGDENEIKSLRHVFGDRLNDIPITAIKSMVGHLLGGAGSLNIVSAIQAMHEGDGLLPVIRNLDQVDTPFEDLCLVRGSSLRHRLDTVLTLSYGFGGFNAIALLARGPALG